jgi:hypothetical protein
VPYGIFSATPKTLAEYGRDTSRFNNSLLVSTHTRDVQTNLAINWPCAARGTRSKAKVPAGPKFATLYVWSRQADDGFRDPLGSTCGSG